MALANIVGGAFIPAEPGSTSATPTFTNTTFVIDAASERVAFICTAPKTGNIAKIGWRTGVVTTGATIDVRLETVDATNGLPTGTLVAANTNVSVVVDAADDQTWFLSTLTAAASVTRGDLVAVVFANPASSFGNMQIIGFLDETGYTTYGVQAYVPPATGASTIRPGVVTFEYSDGSYNYAPGLWPMSALTPVSLSTSTTPDIAGLYFKFPGPVRVAGFWVWMDLDGDANVKLYDSDGSTVLATKSFDTDIRSGTGADVLKSIFVTPQTLLADTFYRLVIEPTTTTAVGLQTFNVNAAAIMDAFPGGQNFRYTSAKDPTGEGSWTQVTTQRPFMGLLIDQIDDGAGAAGGEGPLIGGRLVL